MAMKSCTTEQIIGYLRQGEVLLSQGKPLDAVMREIGVNRNAYYRWRKIRGRQRV
jgi:transposase-like protein